MVKKKSKNAKYEPLILNSAAEKGGIFNEYRPRKEVGEWMLNSFLNPIYNKGIDKGFTINNSTNTLGVISQCYGILTIAEYSKFGMDLGKSPDACAKISAAYNYILSHIHADKEELVFDAASYFDASSKSATSKEKLYVDDYTETVATVLKCSIEMRRLLRDDLNNDRDTIQIDMKYLNQSFIADFDKTDKNAVTRAELTLVEHLMAKCMRILCDNTLTIKGGADYCLKNTDEPLPDANGQKMLYKGWTFTKIDSDKHDRCEPSLYFTYLVSDAYLAFYESFVDSIKIIREKVVAKIKKDKGWEVESHTAVEVGDDYDETYVSEPTQKKETFTVPLDELDEEVAKFNLDVFNKETADVLDDLKFLQANYKEYREFNKAVMDAGHYVDTYFSTFDTTRDFFSYNFKLVTAQNIEDSSSSDALFNVLFAINIMLAAGTDIDYDVKGHKDEFYETLQYTIPNVQRLYKKFLREGKESVCDQYILKFNEALPSDDQNNPRSPFNQVKTLRKQRIFVYALMPVLIKTYTTLSKYLTPYPQYEMRLYEQEIIENKMSLKGRVSRSEWENVVDNPGLDIWLWDKDDFHLITNYNYANALRMFYDYYETYEESFVKAKKEYVDEQQERVKEAKAALEAERRKNIDKLAQQKEQIDAQRTEEIARLKEEFEKEINGYKAEIRARDLQRAPVEDAIGDVVIKYYLENAITQLLKDCLDENRKLDASPASTMKIKERQTDTLSGVLFRLFMSYFREGMQGGLHDITQSEESATNAEDSVYDALNKLLLMQR